MWSRRSTTRSAGQVLDEVLPPFTAGLLAESGRLLSVLAYRDAADYGDQPFKLHSAKARHRVLARLPIACDRQDRSFRLPGAGMRASRSSMSI
jgi:hypothetical protein